MPSEDPQGEVIAFLKSPAAWGGRPGAVTCIETHGALVFLAGDEALKIRRAVCLSYLDFTTLDARQHYARREVEINQPHAPGIYLGLVAVTRERDGRLAVGGSGVPVEWAVRMRRFEEDRILLRVVRSHGIDRPLAIALADMVAAYHDGAPAARPGIDRTAETARSLLDAIGACPDPTVRSVTAQFRAAIDRQIARSADVRARRAAAGHVRRCHGDLHLNNIVVWEGRPTPFDAIEFDEELATIDTLYDLAFLLMDLERNGARETANIVLNRYLWRTGARIDVEGLAALPLFLGLRTGVRAMVALDRARLGLAHGQDLAAHAVATLTLGLADLAPPPPRLIAIGGLSGTGKTTLAARLAPALGASPGAFHVRSDLERKFLAGVDPLTRLDASAYAPEAASAVYARVVERAAAALGAGHTVIVDAVYATPEERAAVERLAASAGVPFVGLWLEGRSDVLKERVAARVGDASDATPQVVERQLGYATGAISWTPIDASRGRDDVAMAARTAIDQAG